MTDETPMAHIVLTVVTGPTDDVKTFSMRLQDKTNEIDRSTVGVLRRRMDIVLDEEESDGK